MEHSEQIYRWAFDHSSDGMLITDTKGVVIRVNEAFVKMFGYTADEVIGNRTSFLKSPTSTPEFYLEMWRSLETKGEWKGEIVNISKSGKPIICFLTITPIISASGEKLGYLGVEIDLTDRKRLEEEIIHHKKLSSIGEAIATMAHEIRNPLNGIKMNTQMLIRSCKHLGDDSAENIESLELILRETERLGSLVNRVLSFARTTQLHKDRVAVMDIINEAAEVTAADREQAGIIFEIDCADPQLTILCDVDKILQVLLNLIRNAVDACRTTTIKRIRIHASNTELTGKEGVSSSGRSVVIDVSDSGVGIDTIHRLSLFEPFFTTKGMGLGLGLAESRKIVREHHGELSAESPLAESERPFVTKFTIALPA